MMMSPQTESLSQIGPLWLHGAAQSHVLSQNRWLCLKLLRVFSPAHPSVRAEVVFVSGVCCRRQVCQPACFAGPDVLRKRWGRGGRIPPLLPKKKKKSVDL